MSGVKLLRGGMPSRCPALTGDGGSASFLENGAWKWKKDGEQENFGEDTKLVQSSLSSGAVPDRACLAHGQPLLGLPFPSPPPTTYQHNGGNDQHRPDCNGLSC